MFYSLLKTIANMYFSFQGIHDVLALIMCIMGSIANVFNMVILTRKEMINATNTILTGLAVADFLLLVEYIFYTASLLIGPQSFNTFSYALFILCHAHYTQVSRCFSIN